MSEVADQLSHIANKTTRLIDLCSVLRDENDLLRSVNQNLKTSIEASKSKNEELQEMVRVLKLARSLEGLPINELGLDEKTLDIKQKISKFVDEIDKCIVLLKRQY
jgi:hypothetical protein